MSALSHQKRIQSLCLSYNNNYTEFSLYQEHCCSFFKSERSKITRSFRSKALDQVYHVYFLLNKSLVQHITGLCLYLIFANFSAIPRLSTHIILFTTVHCFKVIGQPVQLSWKAVWPSAVHNASDSISGGTGFKSRSDHLLDLFSVLPSSNPPPRS